MSGCVLHGGATIRQRTIMRILSHVWAVGVCLAIVACGSSDPPSPLILAGDATDAVPGPRTLTSSQERSLLNVITSSGQPCEALLETYLRDADAGSSARVESWDVRCSDGAYAVLISDDGTPASVRPCFVRYGDLPCFQRDRGPRREPDGSPALNPELGKLLEPMTAKGAKVD